MCVKGSERENPEDLCMWRLGLLVINCTAEINWRLERVQMIVLYAVRKFSNVLNISGKD